MILHCLSSCCSENTELLADKGQIYAVTALSRHKNKYASWAKKIWFTFEILMGQLQSV